MVSRNPRRSRGSGRRVGRRRPGRRRRRRGVGGIVVEAAGEAGEFVGAAGPVDDRPVVDDPEPPLDGPDEVVSLAEVAVGVGSRWPASSRASSASQRLGRATSGSSAWTELEILDEELDIGQAAEAPLQVVRPARFLQLPAHRDDLAGQRPGVDRHGQGRPDRRLDLAAEPPRAWITRARVIASRSQTCAGPWK